MSGQDTPPGHLSPLAAGQGHFVELSGWVLGCVNQALNFGTKKCEPLDGSFRR